MGALQYDCSLCLCFAALCSALDAAQCAVLREVVRFPKSVAEPEYTRSSVVLEHELL